MWAHAAGSMMLASAMLLTSARNASSQSDPKSMAARALPGRIVEVKASEFSFRAPDTIPAGLTSFRLLQEGLVADRLRAGVRGRALVADKDDETRGVHMLWVVRLDSGRTVADLYRAAREGQRTTSWARQLGGPAFAHPPSTTNATLDLEPGNYALVCYIGSARADRARYHLLNGMFRALTVVPSTQRRAAVPKVDIVATISAEKVVTFSKPLRAGRVMMRVQNESDEDLEFKLQRVPAGVTGQAFLAQTRGTGPGVPAGGLSSVPPGATVITTLDFRPGEYIVGTHASIRHATSRVVTVASGNAR